jgi:hypothetical protein
MMQFVEEHQDIPNEVAAVMPVGGLKKRGRVWKLAAEPNKRSVKQAFYELSRY